MSPVYVPPPPLSNFVAFFWHQVGQAVEWKAERLLPTGTVDLVVPLSHPLRMPVLCGPHSRPFFLSNPGSTTVIAAHFRPGGAFPFFGVPASELQNLVIPLDELWGHAAVDLRDRLLEVDSLSGQYRLFESILNQASKKPLERRSEVRFALKHLNRPGTSVKGLVAQVGFSSRHFAQLFKDEVGLTPKSYGRVRRFQRAIAEIGDALRPDLGDLALSCGYFDQAHFANDFKEISGLTLSGYMAQRTPHTNHVPVHD